MHKTPPQKKKTPNPCVLLTLASLSCYVETRRRHRCVRKTNEMFAKSTVFPPLQKHFFCHHKLSLHIHCLEGKISCFILYCLCMKRVLVPKSHRLTDRQRSVRSVILHRDDTCVWVQLHPREVKHPVRPLHKETPVTETQTHSYGDFGWVELCKKKKKVLSTL